MDAAESFGVWLKRRRLALGLTQAALAAHTSCSIVALRKLEADDRRPSAALAVALARALVFPERLQAPFVACARGTLPAEHLPLPETRRCPANGSSSMAMRSSPWRRSTWARGVSRTP